jgi:PAS domain S-box-containing protein
LQLAATALDGTIYDWDVENKTVNRTQGLVDVLGYRPEEVEPTLDWWTQHIHPDDRQRIRNEISDALACRSGFTSEYRVKNKDHDYLYVWDKGLIIRNATGRAFRVVGCTTDITERKQAEDALQRLNQELEHRVRERTTELEQLNQQLKVEIAQRTSTEKALRQREQEFRALVENSPDLISRFDRQLRYLYINPAIEQATSRPRAEFIGKTNRELGIPEPNLCFWEQLTARVFETGSQQVFEFSFATPNGVQHYQARFVPEFAADGSIDSVLGISRDITERKQSEDALRESEERFRQLAENIDGVFWITGSHEFELIYISPAYERIWGKSRASLFEQPKSWLDAVHPEDREYVTTALKKSRQKNYDHEYRIVRPDGSTRWIRDRGFPIQNETGQIYRVVGIAEDITLLKQATIDSCNALQKERELGELKSRFVAMTSHEFRTPLTTIQSSVELLQRYRARWTEEKQLTYLHRIQTAVERMTQMLNDMLTISEAESGKLEFKPTPMDLVQFCQDLVEELQQAGGQQHTLKFTHQYQCMAGSIDAKLLRHILSNLLSNAIKYSPIGSTVEFDLICFDGNAVFQIQDQGIGIPPEEQPRLFESFHRATNVGTIQGTGLGLAIVKQCVELHRGMITVTSEVGQGTRFTVTLPLGN